MASVGAQCYDKALGMASVGLFCAERVIDDDHYRPFYGGGLNEATRREPARKEIPYDHNDLQQQLRQEDDELLALIVAAVQAGVIP